MFSGHSLPGFATEAHAQGVPELAIMRHGRRPSAATMRGYVEEGSLWTDAGEMVEALGGVRVVGAQAGLADGQGAFVQPAGVGVPRPTV